MKGASLLPQDWVPKVLAPRSQCPSEAGCGQSLCQRLHAIWLTCPRSVKKEVRSRLSVLIAVSSTSSTGGFCTSSETTDRQTDRPRSPSKGNGEERASSHQILARCPLALY